MAYSKSTLFFIQKSYDTVKALAAFASPTVVFESLSPLNPVAFNQIVEEEDQPQNFGGNDDQQAQLDVPYVQDAPARQQSDGPADSRRDGGRPLCSRVSGRSGTDGGPIATSQLARPSPSPTPNPSPTRGTAAASGNPPVPAVAVRVTAASPSVSAF